MSNKISGCIVHFKASLPEEEKKLLVEAIQRFSGVESIAPQFDILPGPVSSEPPKNIPAPGPPPPEEHRRVPQPSLSTPEMAGRDLKEPGTIQTESDYLQQRHLIDFAIKWGITSRKVTWESIQSLSPEEIVAKAFDLIKEMPEKEVKKIELQMGKDSP